MKHPEHDLQVSCVRWFRIQYNQHYGLLFKNDNEAKRTPAAGARAKAAGLIAGVPDLFLAIAREPYHGLFIEMKAAKGTISDSQKLMKQLLSDQGYRVEVCKSFEQFQKVVNDYLKQTN